VNTARMIAKIIHDKFENINVYVPYMCTSSGTILSLCAHELYCSPISIFSPIDPHLNGVVGEAEFSISASDIKRVSSLLKDWYCITEQENLIEVLSQDISLASMSSLYTSYEEVRFIAKELISLGGGVDIDKVDVI
ncbi:SDH family Clp fold serine proteinase, partial [Vibrio campbellii]|uniref:SDH family Clp fold serine proteinase n=1 Tax=Vibrio campbellii TaxID=680 RepID=UPI000AFE38A6